VAPALDDAAAVAGAAVCVAAGALEVADLLSHALANSAIIKINTIFSTLMLDAALCLNFDVKKLRIKSPRNLPTVASPLL